MVLTTDLEDIVDSDLLISYHNRNVKEHIYVYVMNDNFKDNNPNPISDSKIKSRKDSGGYLS